MSYRQKTADGMKVFEKKRKWILAMQDQQQKKEIICNRRSIRTYVSHIYRKYIAQFFKCKITHVATARELIDLRSMFNAQHYTLRSLPYQSNAYIPASCDFPAWIYKYKHGRRTCWFDKFRYNKYSYDAYIDDLVSNKRRRTLSSIIQAQENGNHDSRAGLWCVKCMSRSCLS
jgi:hypothetical protein